MSKYSNSEIARQSCDLTYAIGNLCEGRSTAAVYIAIANLLAAIEAEGVARDRGGLFGLLNAGMDEWHRAQEKSDPGYTPTCDGAAT